MANPKRGEIDAVLNGERYVLRLSLGGLAELEAYFKAENLHDLMARFAGGKIAAQDIITILGIGLKGGGNPLSDQVLQNIDCERGLTGLAEIIGQLFAVTFTQDHG